MKKPKRIKTTGAKAMRIVSTGTKAKSVDGETVAKALGAERIRRIDAGDHAIYLREEPERYPVLIAEPRRPPK